MQLDGGKIAVTGAYGALGITVVQQLRSAGARVAAIDRSSTAPNVLGGTDLYGGVDLASVSATVEVFSRIADDFGGLEAIVNIAGTFRWEKIEGGSLDTWDAMYDANLRTAVGAIQAALPHLVQRGRGGRVINIGAAAAVKATAGMGAYAASKAGIARLTEALAEELKDRRITVNALLPSIIDTPRNRSDMPQSDFSQWVTPAQVADVIAFLLSPAADAITGALIPVTGAV